MSVSVVMPCYNEEETIEEVVRAYYEEVVSKIDDSEFIVVDDCSKDNTRNILERLGSELPKLKVLKTPVNSGHGKAMRMGYEAAQKEWIFQVDSDNQFDTNDFLELYALKDDYDFIVGFRRIRHDPLHRLILTRIICFTNLILFGIWIKDANCPFRLIRKKILDQLLKFVYEEAVAPNIMISILARKEGIKTIEVPITHYGRKTGSAISNWKLINFAINGFKQLLELKKITAP